MPRKDRKRETKNQLLLQSHNLFISPFSSLSMFDVPAPSQDKWDGSGISSLQGRGKDVWMF